MYIHAGVYNEYVKDSSDDKAKTIQSLTRELELGGVAALLPDLLEPSPEH